MSDFTPLHAPRDTDDVGANGAVVLAVSGGRVLLAVDEDGRFGAPVPDRLETIIGDDIILGEAPDGRVWWARVMAEQVEAPAGLDWKDLRSVIGRIDDETFNIAGRATQVADWRTDNSFCGRCGAAMATDPKERAMICPVDGFRAYPRLSPAVIMLVERDDGRALLARNVGWPTKMYSTLAGFVEPGESLTDTVRREVREEVGIEVDNIRWYDSQPWPFPNSLMLGFFATYAGGELELAADEISDAQWFSADDLPMLPPRASIARRLIDDWLERQAG